MSHLATPSEIPSSGNSENASEYRLSPARVTGNASKPNHISFIFETIATSDALSEFGESQHDFFEKQIDEPDGEASLVTCQVAPVDLEPGSLVLVGGSQQSGWFVLSLLGEQVTRTKQIEFSNGESIEVDAERESIRLTDSAQKTILSYDSKTGSIELHAPRGNVKLAADQGDLELSAQGKIQLHSRAAVEVATPRLETDSVEVEMRATQLEIATDRTRLVSRKLDAVADTFMQISKNAYHTVANLFQVRAGRSRSIVEGTVETKAERVNMRATGDVKINGKHIHLG